MEHQMSKSMIRISLSIVIVACLLIAYGLANAQTVTVYAVADVSAGVQTCRTVLNTSTPVDVTPVVDNVRGVAAFNFRVCMVSVSAAPEGPNTITMTPYDSIWGNGASVSLPFTRPSATTGGVGSLRLSR
jgi:hypothetical protein